MADDSSKGIYFGKKAHALSLVSKQITKCHKLPLIVSVRNTNKSHFGEKKNSGNFGSYEYISKAPCVKENSIMDNKKYSTLNLIKLIHSKTWSMQVNNYLVVNKCTLRKK